ASQAESRQTGACRTASAANEASQTRQPGRAQAISQGRSPAAAGTDRQVHQPARDPSAHPGTGQPPPGTSAPTPQHPARGPARPPPPGRHRPGANHTSPRTASGPEAPAPSHRGSQQPAPATEATDWRDAVIESERQNWQPKVVQLDRPRPPTPEAEAPE